MPRANRTLKGNKRRAVFDRLVIPENGYQLPPQIREVEPDLPLYPVGQQCNITHVIIYEMYVTYEGKPAKEIHRIKFSDIVGNPVNAEKMRVGYDLKTKQGETITLKWHHNNSNYAKSGLILYNKEATGTSWYEPNWGNVYGVGLEWIACDGSQYGTIWANRHMGYARGETASDGTVYPVPEYYASTYPPEYSPRAVRGGLMIGNPEPDRTMWLMGQELPIRVFPAIGVLGIGVLLGFNPNVMNFVKVAPPIPAYFELSGEGTSRGDAISIRWRKEEFHSQQTRCGFQIVSDPSGLVTSTTPGLSPNSKGVTLTTKPTYAQSGSGGISYIRFKSGSGNVTVRFFLFETDDRGEPIYTLQCLEAVWEWTTGSSCPVPKEFTTDNLPYPLKPTELCAGVEPPPSGGEEEPGDGGEQPPWTNGHKYFCDNSVPHSSVDTTYWVGDKSIDPAFASIVQSQYGVVISPSFWEGRNGWIDLFTKVGTDVPIKKSKITPASFHKYLFKMLSDSLNQTGNVIEAGTWIEFKDWCYTNGLNCLTDLQKASMYMTYRLGVPVNFFNSASTYLQGNVIDVMVDNLILLPSAVYDWIDFNDVAVDKPGELTGAFAMDFPMVELSALSSFINFEPEALLYDISSGIGHRPVDYVKPSGAGWGTPTSVDWKSYWMDDMNEQNYKGYVAAEVGIHEVGHSVAYHGLDVYGTTLHEMPEWLNISGWSSNAPSQSPNDVSTHLVKSRGADKTGGMPKTDAGYEAPVSAYGCFHPAEDFADAYRMYILNPIFLEAKYPKKYQFMVDKVEPMF